MSRWGVRLAYMGLLLAMPALVGCPASGPGVAVYPIAFTFAPAATTDAFTVSSRGSGTVAWHLENLPAWANVAPASGTVGPGGQLVTVTINRGGLAPGSYSGAFDVVAGDSGVSVALNMQVPSPPPPPTLAVSPAALDLGLANISASLTLTNSGGGTVNWSASAEESWLQISPDSGTVAEGEDGDVVTITADRSGLAGGLHTGTIHLASLEGGDVDVSVTLEVPQQGPRLVVGPTPLNFGATTPSMILNVTNTGSGDLTWQLTEDIDWLTLSTDSGTLPPATLPITVTVDRSALSAGPHHGEITATSDGGTATISVDLVVAPPALNVTPLSLQFGSYATSKLLAIANTGSGSLQWEIVTTGFPTWLHVSESAGTVGGTAIPVIVTCDRTGMTAGNYTHTIAVKWGQVTVSIPVSMTVATQPVLTVESGFINTNGEPLVPMGTEGREMDITIRNTGTGTLDWSLDASALPDWLSITPLTGILTGSQINVVHVSVTRGNLDTGGYIYRVPLNSNAEDTYLEVSMQVPLRPLIGVDPVELKLGLDSDIGVSFVANIGDPNTLMSYKVESDKEWLFFSPSTGTSIGTSGPIKDWKRINVAVDRSLLESDGGTGILTVTAIDAAGVPIPDIPQEFITISVEAPSLSFEVAKARVRVPSLVRMGFIMRDVRAGAINVDPAFLQSQNAFRIFEDGIEIEETETNKFVVGWEKLKVNVVLALDLSGSMLDAVNQAGITGPEPLLQLYRETCASLLQRLPSNWPVSLMEFHERPTTSVLHGFTLDRNALNQTLQNLHIQDYGATQLLPAVLSASQALVDEDDPLIPFDDADLRIVVVITDGRRTTPPGDIDDASDTLVKNFTRVYSVGWGQDVDHEPLARLASKTGGHYYSTLPDANGHARRAELERALQMLSDDMLAFRMLGYNTLSEADQAEVRVNGFFNLPDDTPDRGYIQGTFSQQLEPSSVVGDITAGQITLRSNGIDSAGNARAFVHAEYVPRNVNKFLFTVSVSAPYTLSIVPNAENGLVEDWTLQNLGGGTYRLYSATPLPYGAFGDLVQLDFEAVQQPVDVQLTVDNTIYAPDLQPKYFVFANSLTIELGAPSRTPVTPVP